MKSMQLYCIFGAAALCLIIQISGAQSTAGECRGKMGAYNRTDFDLHYCSWCYYFLFQNKPLSPSLSDAYLTLITNSTSDPVGTKLAPDLNNETSVESICSTLTADECNTWILCCQAASDCCSRQLQSPVEANTTQCRSTWDGFACWDDTLPGITNHISCPSFIKFSVPTRSAVKICQSDGTWMRNGKSEWTDYTPCLKFHELRVTLYISFGCQMASLALLVPALFIFIHYKSLRKQHRVRLHINFFLSFIFSGICTSLWNLLVTYDKLTNTDVADTLMHKNLPGCRLLSFLKLYFTSTNYVWMFCEGYYLYRLIANAFSPPKRLITLYVAGWVIPFLYSFAYACVRLAVNNEKCWVMSLGVEEWIIYCPNLACLVANLCFLGIILRILVTQLQAHPNEPSNFRRALKATFVLIPLFGVQLFVTIYRLPQESSMAIHYERFSEVISNSQGFVVAVIFCFCNAEALLVLLTFDGLIDADTFDPYQTFAKDGSDVAAQIKRSWRHTIYFDRLSSSRKLNHTLSLNFNNSTTHRASDHGRRGSIEPCLKTDNTSPSTIQSQF